jgi:hypothetical protein
LNRRQLIIEPGFLQVRQFDAFDVARLNFNKLAAVTATISSSPRGCEPSTLLALAPEQRLTCRKPDRPVNKTVLIGCFPVPTRAKLTPS